MHSLTSNYMPVSVVLFVCPSKKKISQTSGCSLAHWELCFQKNFCEYLGCIQMVMLITMFIRTILVKRENLRILQQPQVILQFHFRRWLWLISEMIANSRESLHITFHPCYLNVIIRFSHQWIIPPLAGILNQLCNNTLYKSSGEMILFTDGLTSFPVGFCCLGGRLSFSFRPR